MRYVLGFALSSVVVISGSLTSGSLASGSLAAQSPVVYRVAFPAPEHHYAQVEVIFSNAPAGTLEARMSRSSPGRYAQHEFAKNVFELRAFDGKGKELSAVRPNPYQWDIAGHDGTAHGLTSSDVPASNTQSGLPIARRMFDRPRDAGVTSR